MSTPGKVPGPVKVSDLEPPCFLCDSGTQRIFVDVADGKVKLDHSDPPCPGWLLSLEIVGCTPKPVTPPEGDV